MVNNICYLFIILYFIGGFKMPVLELIFSPIINDTINLVSVGLYLLVCAILVTVIMERPK